MATALTPWDRLQERLPAGFHARHVALGADEERISSLINVNAGAIGYPLLTSVEDMRDELTEANIDLQNDLVLIEDADGNAVAWAQAWLSSGNAPGAFLIGTVHPKIRGRDWPRDLYLVTRACSGAPYRASDWGDVRTPSRLRCSRTSPDGVPRRHSNSLLLRNASALQ